MKTTHYAIIGCGMMGQEHIRNIQFLENTAVVAIYEPNADMQKIAKQLVPDVVFTQSIEALLAIEIIDCLVIVSPNFTHVDILKQIANTRPLPLLVEKPLFTDAADADFIAELKTSYPYPIWVAMEYRYMPPLAELLKQVSAVTGGVDMLTIKEHRFPFLEKVDDWNRFNKYSGGTLVEKCCHFFDLMRLVMQSNPVSVMASAGQAHNHLDETYGGETPDIWDHGYVIVNFENGSRAMLELCMFADSSRYQEEITALGREGKIECKIPGPSRFWDKNLGEEPIPKITISPRVDKGPQVLDIPVDPKLLDAGDHNGSTFYQHEKFLQTVLGNQEPEVTLHDGWAAVLMGMAAQESARTGQTQTLSL